VRARAAVAGRRLCAIGQQAVVGLGGAPTFESERARQRRVARQRESLVVEVVVDLAVAGRVPPLVILDTGGRFSTLVIAQQVTDFMNQQCRVLFD